MKKKLISTLKIFIGTINPFYPIEIRCVLLITSINLIKFTSFPSFNFVHSISTQSFGPIPIQNNRVKIANEMI